MCRLVHKITINAFLAFEFLGVVRSWDISATFTIGINLPACAVRVGNVSIAIFGSVDEDVAYHLWAVSCILVGGRCSVKAFGAMGSVCTGFAVIEFAGQAFVVLHEELLLAALAFGLLRGRIDGTGLTVQHDRRANFICAVIDRD